MTTNRGKSAAAGAADIPTETDTETTAEPDESPASQALHDEIDRLKAQLAELAAATAEPAPPTPETPAERELREMRERFAAMERQFAELKAKSDAMAGEEPVPVDPDLPTHGLALACGDIAEAPNPHATHHHCDVHGFTVPVKSSFVLPIPVAA